MSSRACLLVAALATAAPAAAQPAPSSESAASAPPPRQAAIGPLPGVGELEPLENPLAGDPNALAYGRRLFVSMNCSGCHGGHAGGGMGPSLRDVTWIYGSNAGDIYDSIARGRANGMPAWGTLLPEPLIWNLTAYIQSLRTPDEPDPPR